MPIIHFPAADLLARSTRLRRGACLPGSVLPDPGRLSVWAEGGPVHHPSHFTHRPALWARVALLAPRKDLALPFLAGVFPHLVLDTRAGDILWLWPWSARRVHLVTVPASHDTWVKSFVLHWTFVVELGITGAAAVVFLRQRTS